MMNFSQKRKRINEMNPVAYQQKLGNLVPEIVRVKLVAGDISSGTVTLNIGDVSGEICSILLRAADGTIRSVTAFTYASGTATITAANAAAGDTVTLMFL